MQDAVIRNIEVIGEAANHVQRVDPTFAGSNPQVPWQVMYAMRNRGAHGYNKIDFEMVWKTIHSDLPDLHGQIQNLLGWPQPVSSRLALCSYFSCTVQDLMEHVEEGE